MFFFAVMAACMISAMKSTAQSYHSENLFYLVGSMDSYQSFVQHADEISIICPDVYQIDSVGVITVEVDRRVLAR